MITNLVIAYALLAVVSAWFDLAARPSERRSAGAIVIRALTLRLWPEA